MINSHVSIEHYWLVFVSKRDVVLSLLFEMRVYLWYF